MSNKLKIYIAGKISGCTPKQFHKKFDDCADWIRRNVSFGEDYEVINPTTLCEDDWPWLKCMETCVPELRKSDFLFLMPDWMESKGAVCEYYIAVERGIMIEYLEDDGVDAEGRVKYKIKDLEFETKIKCLTE